MSFVSSEPGMYFLFRLFLYFGRLVRLTVRLSFAEVDGCFLSCCILIKFGCWRGAMENRIGRRSLIRLR